MLDAIHIGTHKAASTYLQHEGFNSHPEIHAITWKNNPEMRGLMWSLTRGDNTYKRNELTGKIRQLRAQVAPGVKIVWSFEGLSGHMFNGHNSQFIAKEIADLFTAPIILILREPYSYIESCWCHYVREGGGLSLAGFLSSKSSPVRVAPPGLKAASYHGLYQKLMYGEYVAGLFELFGSERTNIFFFEDLQNNLSEFMKSLYQVVDVSISHKPEDKIILPTDQKVSATQAKFLRIINHFSRTLHMDPLLSIPTVTTYSRNRRRIIALLNRLVPDKPVDVRKSIPAEIQASICASNCRLSDIIGRDLSMIGYDCD